jgi:hypothetical protein
MWSKVVLQAPTEAEQLTVLQGLFPELALLLPIAQSTVRLVQMAGGHAAAAASAVGQTPPSAVVSWAQQAAAAALQGAGVRPGELSLSLGRQFSTRDLIKWCGRMTACHGPLLLRSLRSSSAAAAVTLAGKKVKGSKAGKKAAAATAASESTDAAAAVQVADLARLDEQLKLAAYQEAADLFAGLVAKHEVKLRLLAALAGLWGLAGPAAVAEQYEELAKPHMHLGSNELQVGWAGAAYCSNRLLRGRAGAVLSWHMLVAHCTNLAATHGGHQLVHSMGYLLPLLCAAPCATS